MRRILAKMILNSVCRAIFLVPHTHLEHDLWDVMQTWPGDAWCFEVTIRNGNSNWGSEVNLTAPETWSQKSESSMYNIFWSQRLFQCQVDMRKGHVQASPAFLHLPGASQILPQVRATSWLRNFHFNSSSATSSSTSSSTSSTSSSSSSTSCSSRDGGCSSHGRIAYGCYSCTSLPEFRPWIWPRNWSPACLWASCWGLGNTKVTHFC